MKTRTNYQPEDIEALLAEKPFHELYAEEKAFVLEHLSSAAEYEQMRETLLSIRGAAGEDQSSKPLRTSPRVKKELMAAFEKEKKKRALIWWNSFGLFLRTSLRFDLPVVRFGFAAVVLLLGIWIFFRMNGNGTDNNPVLVKNENTVSPAENPVKENPLVIALADSALKKNLQPSNTGNETELKKQDQFAVQPSVNNKTEIQIPDARDTMKSADGSTANLLGTNTKIRRNPLENVIVTGPFNGYVNTNNMNFNNNVSNNISNYSGNPNLFVTGANGNQNTGNDSLHRKNTMANQLGSTAPDSNLVVGIESVNGTAAVCCGSTVTFSTSPNLTYNWTPNTTFTVSGTTNYSLNSVTIFDANGGTFQTVVPKSRSLAADAGALAFYCELK